jgi:HK97 family phage prohead protease
MTVEIPDGVVPAMWAEDYVENHLGLSRRTEGDEEDTPHCDFADGKFTYSGELVASISGNTLTWHRTDTLGKEGDDKPSGDPKLMNKYIKKEPSDTDTANPWVIVSKHTGKVLARFASEEAAQKGWADTMQRIHSHGKVGDGMPLGHGPHCKDCGPCAGNGSNHTHCKECGQCVSLADNTPITMATGKDVKPIGTLHFSGRKFAVVPGAQAKCSDTETHTHAKDGGPCIHSGKRIECKQCGDPLEQFVRPDVGAKSAIHYKSFDMPAIPAMKLNLTPGAGYLEGYAAVFGNVDAQGDVIRKGAFAKTIKERIAAGKVKLMVVHVAHGGGTREVIGTVTQAKEDGTGLWIHADFAGDDISQAQRTKCKEGHVKGLSIGYVTLRADDVYIDGKSVQELQELKLLEVTLTPFAANELAQVTAAKCDRCEHGDHSPTSGTHPTAKVDWKLAISRRRLKIAGVDSH